MRFTKIITYLIPNYHSAYEHFIIVNIFQKKVQYKTKMRLQKPFQISTHCEDRQVEIKQNYWALN